MEASPDLLPHRPTPQPSSAEGRSAALPVGSVCWALAGCTGFFPSRWEALRRSVRAQEGAAGKTPHSLFQALHICNTLRTPQHFNFLCSRKQNPERGHPRIQMLFQAAWDGSCRPCDSIWFGQHCGRGTLGGGAVPVAGNSHPSPPLPSLPGSPLNGLLLLHWERDSPRGSPATCPAGSS